MHRQSSTVLGGLELGERTRTPATFFDLGAKVCHPSLSILCRYDKVDGPLAGFEAEIGHLPHTAGTVCDVNLCTGFLLWHLAYRKCFKIWRSCDLTLRITRGRPA